MRAADFERKNIYDRPYIQLAKLSSVIVVFCSFEAQEQSLSMDKALRLFCCTEVPLFQLFLVRNFFN